MNLKQFGYTAELEKAAQNSKWNDGLSEPTVLQPQPIDWQAHIEVNSFQLKHSLASLLQFEETLYYFFLSDDTTSGKTKEFSITVAAFKKKDGENHKVTLKGFKGTPSALATGLMKVGGRYRSVAVIGLEQGFVKVVQLEEGGSGLRTSVNSHKVEQKVVVGVVMGHKHHYGQRNICFLLLQDNKVFVYNYFSRLVLAIFQPPVLSHDFALCLALHPSGNYLATASKSGQIFFWELTKQVHQVIERSQEKKKRKQGEMRKEYEAEQWQFTAKDRVINVFPMYALHSASVHGLKWISFYGNLLATVSRTGLFRMIAVNFQLRDEFLTLIQYQIEDGEAISTLQIFPDYEILVAIKTRDYVTLLSEEECKQRAGDQATQRWRQEAAKKGDYNARMNGNCYGPGKRRECVMEKIHWSNQLRVESVERVRAVQKGPMRKMVDFKYAIVSQHCGFLLLGNDSKYFIAPCDDFFGVER